MRWIASCGLLVWWIHRNEMEEARGGGGNGRSYWLGLFSRQRLGPNRQYFSGAEAEQEQRTLHLEGEKGASNGDETGI